MGKRFTAGSPQSRNAAARRGVREIFFAQATRQPWGPRIPSVRCGGETKIEWPPLHDFVFRLCVAQATTWSRFVVSWRLRVDGTTTHEFAVEYAWLPVSQLRRVSWGCQCRTQLCRFRPRSCCRFVWTNWVRQPQQWDWQQQSIVAGKQKPPQDLRHSRHL